MDKMPNYKINNVELYYEIHGNGEPILFLHGLGSSTQDWEKQSRFFANEYKVFLLDLPGHGKSSKPEGDYSLDIFANSINFFILNIVKEPAHIVGISLGAMVACSVASISGSLVKSLTLVNCPARYSLKSFKNKSQYYIRLLIIHLFGMESIGKFVAPKLFPKPEQADTRDLFVRRWAKNDKKSYIKSMQLVIGWDIFNKVDLVTCPVYAISAEYDYFPLEEKRQYVQQFKNAKLKVINNTRHALPFEAPDEFNNTLLELLKET